MDCPRRKILSFSPEVLLKLLDSYPKEGTPICDLPSDLQTVSSAWDPQKHSFLLTVEHKSFDEVGKGAEIPLVEVDLTKQLIPRRKANIII